MAPLLWLAGRDAKLYMFAGDEAAAGGSGWRSVSGVIFLLFPPTGLVSVEGRLFSRDLSRYEMECSLPLD